ncbi:Zinc finger putative Transcription Factor family [Ditylenchus destructor]|uniref:Zinc finger putative Transcription Factor family n=1 Tax=Ditylenchus destructor TaxID=166010 RepID=A0AAD4QYB6_9BILA|nr:Zinc finger putative Transcription Factor family [Ditylenchus destructor]
MECTECYRILALKEDVSVESNLLEQLEVHLANDHFHLYIYECSLCLYAKFATEQKLVDHYSKTHKSESNVEIRYKLDASTIEVRRQIRECLNKYAFGRVKGGPLAPPKDICSVLSTAEILGSNGNVTQTSTQGHISPNTFAELMLETPVESPKSIISVSSKNSSNFQFLPDDEKTNTIALASVNSCLFNFINTMNTKMSSNTNCAELSSGLSPRNPQRKPLSPERAMPLIPNKHPSVPIPNGGKCEHRSLEPSLMLNSTQRDIQTNFPEVKKRKVKLSRDINMPPRPISAYLHFSNANRSVIQNMADEKNISYHV